MSVIIRGLQMPETCGECPCLRVDNLEGVTDYQCNVTLKLFRASDEWIYDERDRDCPLADTSTLLNEMKERLEQDAIRFRPAGVRSRKSASR